MLREEILVKIITPEINSTPVDIDIDGGIKFELDPKKLVMKVEPVYKGDSILAEIFLPPILMQSSTKGALLGLIGADSATVIVPANNKEIRILVGGLSKILDKMLITMGGKIEGEATLEEES